MVVKSGGGVGGAEEGAAGAAVRRWVEAGGGRLVLDGGLATELEAHGADLNDPLWSAKCILSSPHLIRKARPAATLPFLLLCFCFLVHVRRLLTVPIARTSQRLSSILMATDGGVRHGSW